MTHPSPLAIQFLYDLRRVVDVAKERIRQRRFIPALPVIIEDVENEIDYVEAVEGPVDIASSATPESSPRSEQKSVDSGRESRDESEEDEETAPGTEGQKEISTMTQSKVSDIVKCMFVDCCREAITRSHQHYSILFLHFHDFKGG